MAPKLPAPADHLSAEAFVAIQATMDPEVREELNVIVKRYPPTTWDNFAAVTSAVAGMVLQGKIHPTLAASAVRYFELSFTSLMVAQDKHRPAKATDEKSDLLAILSQAANAANDRKKELPNYGIFGETASVEILEPAIVGS